MNTTEVVKILARKLNISQAAARTVLQEKLHDLGNALITQESIDLPGLGTMQVQETRVRRQFIPGKNSICIIPAHKRLIFKINNLLKAHLRRQDPY